MKNVLVISALVLASSVASAVTVRGTGRYYIGGEIKTVKQACSSAVTAAEKSLADKCALLGGQTRNEANITLDPAATKYEGFCTAYAEANCE